MQRNAEAVLRELQRLDKEKALRRRVEDARLSSAA